VEGIGGKFWLGRGVSEHSIVFIAGPLATYQNLVTVGARVGSQ